ncbi:baseplate hub subunit and tail length [Pseudomonas phage PspYZU05]|uniref:Baseplate hub subunit tail length determinator n=1 Tax=Pseudomonas phage PspYZU05 TaxID=1983556 RepID=A0A2U7N2N5_9CAUD|nr:baseplate hub subunit and tail length [Pseudomonas phage PspYZU05]ASD52105.1 baseplate hub subunit tail length determinator [Pseudomonas phage PspYZU05]
MAKGKSSSMNTMRRRVIEEKKPAMEQASAALEQKEAISGLGDKLADVQASNELTSEVIETKGNQILDSLDGLISSNESIKTSIDDNTAANELLVDGQVETNSKLTELNSISQKLHDKLGALGDKLSVNSAEVQTRESSDTSTLEAIKNAMPIQVIQPELNSVLEKLQSPVVSPTNDIIPPTEEEKPNKEPPEKEKTPESAKLDLLLGLTKTGFSKSIAVTDRISNMLFKYTVSAMASMAKTAAMIFAIVLAIDLIMIHFKHWSKMFDQNFQSFRDKLEEWAPLFQSIFQSLESIKKFWQKGDWGGLIGAIVEGVGSAIYHLAELISLGMSKVVAAIVEQFDKDTALDIKGSALQVFQERTGAKLDEEDQDTLARYQSKKVMEGESFYDQFQNGKTKLINNVAGDKDRTDYTTKEERDRTNEMMKAMPEEERVELFKKANEARATLISLEKRLETIDPGDTDKINSVKSTYEELYKQVNDDSLNKAPALKKELDLRYKEIQTEYQKLTVSPTASDIQSNDDVKTSTRIQQSEPVKQTETPQQTMANFNATNVFNNSTMFQLPPTTSTRAPGIFAAVQVN